MQDFMVLTSGGLNKLPEPAPDSRALNQLKRAGFKELYDRIGSPAANQLRALRNAFDELSSEDITVLRFKAKHTEYAVDSFTGDVPISQIAMEIETAKRFGLRLKILAITRDTGLKEWVLVGERKIGGTFRRFMIARWGAYVEDLATLYQRREVTLVTEAEAKRLKEAAKQKRERQQQRRRLAAKIGGMVVGAVASCWVFWRLIDWARSLSDSVHSAAPSPSVVDPVENFVPVTTSLTAPLINMAASLWPLMFMVAVVWGMVVLIGWVFRRF